MLKFLGLLVLFGWQLCHAKEHHKPEPQELQRYQTLRQKRLVYHNFKQSALFTVPGYTGKEAEDDNEPPFLPSLECGDEFYNLTKGAFGTITSPNYPRRYQPDLQCEWILESVPGTVIEATFFDSVTQPWLFGFYDYIKVSLDGNWTQFHRFAGDINYKTPYTLVSKGNRIVVRFVTSSWLNFRGFSMFYAVRNRHRGDNSPQVNEFGSVQNNNVVAVCNRKPVLPPKRDNDKFIQNSNVKIINGEVAVAHQYPFTVALLIDGQYFCAGTLLDDTNILTAAHCVADAERIVAIFGLHNMTNPAERYYSRQIRLIEFPQTANHVFLHPHFNPDSGANDIAIVRVLQKVKLTGYVQPIYLPSIYSASNTFYGKDLKTVGWGQYDINSDGISTVLREGRARVISNHDCREEFRGAITGNNLCTLTPFKPTESPENANSTTTAPLKYLTRSNITNENENPEEIEESETEASYQPDFISPCFGDAGGPLFADFKETADGTKEPIKQECVDARPNGSSDDDDDLKNQPACDRPKELSKKWYVLVGVVSFGTKVCGEDIPVAYSRVSAYLEWIAYVTGRHG
ncbi:Chymotrypsin BI [Orchesella cincta]|uniref:Chymotrypsin BI n=1 Tax=Orchesella cincta TaxID=48709 RepID=A0A1D2N8V3_ORCCI|nr:Chymotrypsin BI [Orchesella cincta]